MRACLPIALLVTALLAACSNGSRIDSTSKCIDSFQGALANSEPGLRRPAENETAWGAFQDTDEWEGRTPVCWVNYSSEDSCLSFMYDLNGRWAEAKWIADDEDHPGACLPDDAADGEVIAVSHLSAAG